ncbi:MAG: hypothetical protein MI976_21605 [Pseudomonadales bacterium]|nr:hypothetical protein [Pseudomonadales bacterium]
MSVKPDEAPQGLRHPGFLRHLYLLWHLKALVSHKRTTRFSRFGGRLSALVVFLPGLALGLCTFWFMTQPTISEERVVSQFYLNILCFVTAMLWILWPVLSAGIEDSSERTRFRAVPISEFRLLVASMLSGLAQPVGIYMFAPLTGACLGYARSQHFSFDDWGLALVLLVSFVAMCATWSQVGVYWLRDVMQAKRNGQALTLSLLVLILVGMLLPQVDISWLYEQATSGEGGLTPEIDEFARIAQAFSKIPPGYLGEGLMALSEGRLLGVCIETLGMVLLAILGLMVAKRQLVHSQVSPSTFSNLEYSGAVFSKNGTLDSVLEIREAYELWRNSRVRLLIAVPIVLVVVLHLVSALELLAHFWGVKVQVWMLTGVGCYSTALLLLTFTHNVFAYDGRSLLTLISAPITPLQILNAKARVHRAMSFCVGAVSVLFYWLYVAPEIHITWLLLTIIAIGMVVPVSTSIGLWVSIYFPVKFDASLNRKQRQPFYVALIGFAGVLMAALPMILAIGWLLNGGTFIVAIGVLTLMAMIVWCGHIYFMPNLAKQFADRQAEILAAITRS